jgi:hypothetical protein
MGFSRVEERLTMWPEQFPTLAAVEARGRAIEIDVRQYLATLTDETRRARCPMWMARGAPGRILCGGC